MENKNICTYRNVYKFSALRVCLLQFASQKNISQTLNHLEELVSKAVKKHQPNVIALPECFNFAYCSNPVLIQEAAEPIDGQTSQTLSRLAKQHGVFIVGGSILREEGKMYNSILVWNSNGELITRYNKVSYKSISEIFVH